MVALLSLGLSAAGTLALIAVAWGVFSTRVQHLERRQDGTEEDVEKLKGQHSDTAVRLARIEEQQAQSISLLGELKALLTKRRR
jgi:hypothetical protein